MANILFKNIKELLQVREQTKRPIPGLEMKSLPTIKKAFLIVEDDKILDFGEMKDCPEKSFDGVKDLSGQIVLPSWCDSHTHIVYAGNREGEFIDRINGLSYEEIAKKGGGIVNSASTLQNTSEEDLYNQSKQRLEEVIGLGTGAIEIKSGYGLTPEAELKMLRVIKRLKENYSIPIKSTFLAAHALPKEYKERKEDFINLMLNEVLPIVKEEELAEYIDVFCETGYFSSEDTEKIIKAANKFGLKAKIHVNQFTAIGGIQTAVNNFALSVDHLEVLEDDDIEILKDSQTIPVALPTCSYFLSIPYSPVRKILDANLPLALASDYNPGSTPSGNMNFVVSTACIKMRITPQEAINAATVNAAFAMGLEDEVGSITRGKLANLIVTKPINSYGVLPYAFGSNNIDSVYLKGEKVNF